MTEQQREPSRPRLTAAEIRALDPQIVRRFDCEVVALDINQASLASPSRLEPHAQPGTIQVTQRAFERLREHYQLRGDTIELKGGGH